MKTLKHNNKNISQMFTGTNFTDKSVRMLRENLVLISESLTLTSESLALTLLFFCCLIFEFWKHFKLEAALVLRFQMQICNMISTAFPLICWGISVN